MATELTPERASSLADALAERPTWRAMLSAPFRALPEAERLTLTTAAVLAERLSPRPLADAFGVPVREVSTHLAAGVKAELETIAARHYVLSYPQAIAERTEVADRAMELGGVATTTMGALWGLLWQADLAFQRGDYGVIPELIGRMERVAQARHSPVAAWHGLRLRAGLDVLAGDLDSARDLAARGRLLAERVGDVSMMGMHFSFHVQLVCCVEIRPRSFRRP